MSVSKIGMTMMLANRNRSNRGGDRDGRTNNETQNNYGMESNQDSRMRGGYDMESNYEMDSRFRDRRGREHYDNGRFAPMRNEMQSNRWYPPYYGVEINRYELDDSYNGRRQNGREDTGRMNQGGYSDMNMERRERMDSNYAESDSRRGGNEMRMIGFERENDMRMASDASMPHYREMDRMAGMKAEKGGATSTMDPEFNEHTAKAWTSKMENEDGTSGPHWTMEQAKKVIEQRGLRCDPYEFWAVLNSIYSDDVAVAKKHGVNKLDYYVDRAVAWLEDKDAVKDKAAAYYEYIVKH